MLPSSSVSRVGGRETCDELEKRKKHETSLGHCCGYVPEDPASLLIDRLAGKWAIKNFSPARARSAATCPGRPALELEARGNFPTSTETRKVTRGLTIPVQTTSRRFSENLFHDFFHTCGTGKSQSAPSALLFLLLKVPTRFHNLFLNLRK